MIAAESNGLLQVLEKEGTELVHAAYDDLVMGRWDMRLVFEYRGEGAKHCF